MKQSHLQFSFTFLLLALAYGRAQPQPGTLLWSYDAAGEVTGSPTLAPDGTIYLGTTVGLYAITNAGSNRWTFPAGQPYFCSPAIGTDGTIYLGDGNANFYAVNPDGSQRWTFPLQPEFQHNVTYASSPALGLDDTVYFVATGRLYALSPAGAKKWEYAIDTTSTPVQTLSPVIGSDGTIYVGSFYNRIFYAINSDGTEKWEFATSNGCGDSAAVGTDGTVSFTGTRLYTLSANAIKLWENATNSFASSSPVIGRNGTIYVASDANESLYAISPSGQKLWNAGYGWSGFGYVTTAPAIDAGGMIYYSASNSVFAINSQGLVQWIFSSPYVFSGPPPLQTRISPTIGPDGTIYAAFGSTLYAIKGSTNGPTDSPWPMYRQNPRHTGRIEKPALNQPKKRADANFQFQIYTDLGKTNTIQTSPDLTTWTPLTNVVITNVPMDFIDWDASNFTSRFYRAVQQ